MDPLEYANLYIGNQFKKNTGAAIAVSAIFLLLTIIVCVGGGYVCMVKGKARLAKKLEA